MQLIKYKQNLVLIEENTGELIESFPLITSIFYFKGSWFEPHLRWKVIEDKDEVLAPLLNRALVHLTKSDLEQIRFYENYYNEMKHPNTRESRDEYNSSQKDIYGRYFKDEYKNEK